VIFHEFSGTYCVSKIEVSLEADVQAVTDEQVKQYHLKQTMVK
jgi:hypothetical protein